MQELIKQVFRKSFAFIYVCFGVISYYILGFYFWLWNSFENSFLCVAQALVKIVIEYFWFFRDITVNCELRNIWKLIRTLPVRNHCFE